MTARGSEPDSRPARAIAYVLLPILLGLFFISPVFFFRGYSAYDMNDEVAHTFLEIPLAWKMIRAGEFPFINLYNNFGTPLLGDPVVLPFAPQAVSYLLLSGPVAATVNRFLMISLTVALMTFVLRKHFGRSLPVSSACASFFVMNPNFNYFSQHHPHQGSILYFLLILVLQERMRERMTTGRALALYAGFLAFTLGVGMNGFLVALPFLFLGQWISSDFRADRPFLAFCALFLAALLFAWPQFGYFSRIMTLTARATLRYADLTSFTFPGLLSEMVSFGSVPGMMHLQWTVYYSIPVLLLAGAALTLRDDRDVFRHFVMLGALPLVTTAFLLGSPGIRGSIPFLRSMDLGRLLWYANVYLFLGIARVLDKLYDHRRNDLLAIGTAFGGCLSVFLWLWSFYRWALPFGIGCLLAAAILLTVTAAGYRLRRAAFAMAAGGLLVGMLPCLIFSTGSITGAPGEFPDRPSDFFFHRTEHANLRFRNLPEYVEPFSRIAMDMAPPDTVDPGSRVDPTSEGSLQNVALHGILGSSGRSIILHKGLRDYLLDRRLIAPKSYGMSYFFDSSDSLSLSLLGIEYALVRDGRKYLDARWKSLAEWRTENPLTRKMEVVTLLSNPRDATPAYLLDEEKGPVFQKDLSYTGTDVRIRLDATQRSRPADLVLTFVDWPGWKAYVDGRFRELLPLPNHLLCVPVDPSDREVVFRFRPYGAAFLIGCVVLSLALAGGIAWLLPANRPTGIQ